MAKRKARTTVPAAATRESKRLRSSNADDNSLQILDARGRPVPQPPGKAWAGTAAGAFVGGKARLQRNAAGRSTGKGAAAVSVASPPAGQDSKNGERAVDRGAADEDAGDVQAPEDAARSGEVSGEEQGVEASGDDKMPGLRVLQHVLGLQGPVVVDENSRGQLPEDALNHEQAPARATTGEQPTFSLSDARQNGTPDIRRAEGRVEEAADPAAARSESENPTRTPDRDAQDDAQREKLMQVSASLITAQSRVHWLQDTLRRSEAALKRCQSLCGRVTQLCDDHGGEQSSRLVAVGRMRLAAFEARFGELGALERVLLQLIAAITPLVPRLMKQEVALEKGQRPGDVVGSDITLLLTEAQRNIDDAETLIDHILLAERSLVVEVIPSFLRMAKPNEEQQKRGASLTDHGIQRRLTVPDVQEGEILTFLETHGELGRNAALRAEANTVGTEAYYAGLTTSGRPRRSVEHILFLRLLDFIAAQDYYKLVSFWEHPNLAEASEELNSAGEWLDQAGLEAEEAGYDIRHYACQEDRVNILETIASTRRPSQSSSVVEAANLLPFQYLRTRKTEKELVHMHHDRLYNCRREFEAIAGRPFEESNHATQEDTVLLTRTVKARDNLISSMNQARVDGFSVGSDGSLLGRALTGPESLEIERRPRDRLEVDARATLLRAGVGRYLATVLPLQCQTLRQYGVVDTLDAKEAALTSVAKGLEIRKPPTLYTVPDDETKSEYGKRMALIHHMTLTRDRARVRNELRTFDPARRFSAESCECPICKGEVELG